MGSFFLSFFTILQPFTNTMLTSQSTLFFLFVFLKKFSYVGMSSFVETVLSVLLKDTTLFFLMRMSF